MARFTTACPRNCYSTCSMVVEVEGGRIRRIEPHPGNRATPEGVCLKGLAYIERVTAQDRILYPLRRAPNGAFHRVDWDEALELICHHLEGLREQPQSVMVYTGSGTKGLLNSVTMDFWKLFGGCTTTYGDLCWPAGLEATRLSLGDNRHSAPWDLANARLIVLWGKNAAETNVHQMRFVEQAVERGARLVVVDPRRSQTAESADLLVQPRPGTDGALALGIAHQMIESRRVDGVFVARHVLGYERFCSMVKKFSPGRVEGITGVPASTVIELAEWMGTTDKLTICAGFGMQRYSNSGQTMRAMIALLALTGNFGKPGAGWVYANLQSQVFSGVRDPLALYPPDDSAGPVRVSVSTSRLGEHMLQQADPRLRMIWVERGNPVSQNPDSARVVKAFRALDFRVVVDQFLTDTAREADLVLPAKTMFEQSDVINAYWHAYLQLKQKVIEPPGEVKPESEIYRLLAARLGLPPEQVEALIPGPSDAAVEAYLERRLAPLEGIDLEVLRKGPVLAPGVEEVAWADLNFATPSGRIELFSSEASARWQVDELPEWYPQQESAAAGSPLAEAYPLHLITPNTKNRIHSQFNNLPSIRALDDRALVHLNPEDAAARGIGDGARVRVVNGRGTISLEARLDHGLLAGCAWISNGWWACQEGAVNRLSVGRETDMGYGAAFHDTLVQVELE